MSKKSSKTISKMIKSKSFSLLTSIQIQLMKILNVILQLIAKKKTRLKLKIAIEARVLNQELKYKRRLESKEILRFQIQMMAHKSKTQTQKHQDQ